MNENVKLINGKWYSTDANGNIIEEIAQTVETEQKGGVLDAVTVVANKIKRAVNKVVYDSPIAPNDNTIIYVLIGLAALAIAYFIHRKRN